MAERVLITGGAGFVGANLTRRCLALGYDVSLLLLPDSDTWRLQDVREHCQAMPASLSDADEVRSVVEATRPDRVFHLAAHGAYPTQREVGSIFEANVMGTVNLVDACLRTGVGSLVNTGTSSEYGYQDHAPSESEPIEPNSDYAVSKAAATMHCRYTSLDRGVPLTTLRLYSVYGAWEEPTRLMPTLASHGIRGHLPPLVSPSIARDFVHVDDAVAACLLASDPSVPCGSVYNIATGVQTSLAELAALARAVHGIDDEPRWGSMAPRSWDTDTWVGNASRIAEQLGWRATTSLAEGYRDLVDWISGHPSDRYT